MLRAAFRMFDLDNDGWVTFEEIRTVLQGNGIQEICDWQTLLTQIGLDECQPFQFNEFFSIMQNTMEDTN